MVQVTYFCHFKNWEEPTRNLHFQKHDSLPFIMKSLQKPLTIPPPKERSQLPISVFATMRQIVSACVQPTASTAIARCAKGILSSLTRIWVRTNKVPAVEQYFNYANLGYISLTM